MRYVKTNLKKILFAALFFSASFLYADSWFVCLASYHYKENAISAAQNYQRNGLNIFIKEYAENENDFIYRVFLNESFPVKTEALNRKENLENNDSLSDLRLNGLWCVQLPMDQAVQKPKMKKAKETQKAFEKKVDQLKENSEASELPEIVEISIIEEVPVEKIVEVIKEITVEKIVQVIKEVPVEVIKEVPVEKIIEVIKEVPVYVQPENSQAETIQPEAAVIETETPVEAFSETSTENQNEAAVEEIIEEASDEESELPAEAATEAPAEE